MDLRIGTPLTLLCFCNSLSWLQPTYFAEVSFYYCNASDAILFSRDFLNRNKLKFKPLFAITRRNSTISTFSSFQYLSEGAAALSDDLQFSLPPQPDPYIPYLFVRLNVPSVKSTFQGAFFCRVRIISTEYDLDTHFDSDVIILRAFGMKLSS